MKHLVFATLMCISALSAKAQVLTSETVKKGYETAVNMPESDFCYNADYTEDDITTMYVYQKSGDSKNVQLTPYRKHDYTYAADGMLTSKVTSRYDYSLDRDIYSIEYSHFNNKANSFEQPVDKMIYTLQPYSDVHYISHYRRQDSSTLYQLISEMQVIEMPLLFAKQYSAQ